MLGLPTLGEPPLGDSVVEEELPRSGCVSTLLEVFQSTVDASPSSDSSNDELFGSGTASRIDLRSSGNRKIVPLKRNVTASRLAIHDEAALEVPHEIPIASLADAVRDHAARRVSLFYHLLVGYYREGVTVQETPTKLQHGNGGKYGWSAAHSHLLPNLCDNFFERLLDQVASRGINRPVRAKLRAFGVSEEVLESAQQQKKTFPIVSAIEAAIPPEGRVALFVRSCHFYHSMNSTVVMPMVVNQVDEALESSMRAFALSIVNEVSMGDLTPYQGVDKLLHGDREAGIDGILAVLGHGMAANRARRHALEKLHQLEVRLQDAEREMRTKGYGLGSLKEYAALIGEGIALRQQFEENREYALGYNVRRRTSSHHELFRLVEEGCEWSDPSFVSELRREIQELPEWDASRLADGVELFGDAVTVIGYQRCATDLPEESLLLETVQSDREITPEKLFEQKLINIART